MAKELSARHRVRLLATAPVAAGLTLLTGCTSGGSGHAAPKHDATSVLPGMPGATGPATPAMPGMSMPGMSMPAGDTAAAPAPAAVGGHAVAIQGFAFSPQKITVKVGTTITWTNRDQDAHTVTAKSGPFHSKAINTGGTFSYTFTRAGSYDYYCTIHPFMTATVVVTQ